MRPSPSSPLETIELFQQQYAGLSFPPEFLDFLKTQEQRNHTIYHQTREVRLNDLLQTSEVSGQAHTAFLTETSHVIPCVDYDALIQLPPAELTPYLLERFAPVFDLQQIVLDGEARTGFNRHDSHHVSRVVTTALSLVRKCVPPAELTHTEVETIIGGLFHDLGNLMSRKHHGLYGLYLLTQLFYNYNTSPATLNSFLRMLEIVVFHEVEFAASYSLLNDLTPPTLAVIVADKTDMGFRRVSAKSNVDAALDDLHVVINLVVSDSKLLAQGDPVTTLRWEVDYQTKFDETLKASFSSLLKETGRVKYPQEWTALYEDGNIEYLFLFQSTFLHTYLSRLYLTMVAAFRLFPTSTYFELVIEDSERGISLKRTFFRQDYPERIRLLGKLFYREKWPGSSLYRALNLM